MDLRGISLWLVMVAGCGPSTEPSEVLDAADDAASRSVRGSASPRNLTEDVIVGGDGFSVSTLDNGESAFGNRQYVFRNVPTAMRGWQYTQSNGGDFLNVAVSALRDGRIVIGTGVGPGQDGAPDLTGWEPYTIEGVNGFNYDDAHGTKIALYSRCFRGSDPAVVLPQGAWTGTLVFASNLVRQSTPPPGQVAIDYLSSFQPKDQLEFVGSPSIVILPSGKYIASHDIFSLRNDGDVTRVFASTDRGATWQQISSVRPQWWSSLFVRRGSLYLLGVSHRDGDIVIRRSEDEGITWTDPRDQDSGLIFHDPRGRGYGGAPTPVIVQRGRIWRAFEYAGSGGYEAGMISAPDDPEVDLLKSGSWTLSNTIPAASPPMIPGGWLEGNAVPPPNMPAVPEGVGVYDILRVNQRGILKAAKVTISADGTRATFNPDTDYIDLPTGDAKFSIRYDPVSDKYWSLVNDQRDKKNYRNVLILVSSRDLQTWDIASTVLQDPDPAYVAFQYVDFQFDGDDIVLVSRTAWSGANTAHNANYETFKRIHDFRALR